MVSTASFLHHHAALSAPSRSSSSSQCHVSNIKPTQLVCRALKQGAQEDDSIVASRRLVLSLLIGAAAVGSKVSPADAAYGEAGGLLFNSPAIISLIVLNRKINVINQ